MLSVHLGARPQRSYIAPVARYHDLKVLRCNEGCMPFQKCIVPYTVAAVMLAAAAYAARRPGEPLRPGFNLFSKEQDVQLGDANAKEVIAQYRVADNQFLQDYVRRVGNRLAAGSEPKQTPFQFPFPALTLP